PALTASSHNVTYGAAVPTITPSYSGFITGESATDLTTAPTCSTAYVVGSSVAGSPYATSCSGAVDSNYAIGYTPGAVTVGTKTLTITASSHNVTYGAAVPTITPSYSGFITGESATDLTTAPTCSTAYVVGSSVAGSPYATSCSGAVDSNYAIGYTPGAVTVGTKTLTITASSHNVTYGAAVPTITPSYSGFITGESATDLTTAPTCSTAYVVGSSVAGSPYATSCSGAVDSNYAIGYTPGAVTVGTKTLTITASSHNVTYGAAVPTITPSYSGFITGESATNLTTAPTCSTAYVVGSSVAGSPYATSCSGAVDSNYAIGYTPGAVTVGTKTLTITASSHNVTYGAAVPTITPSYS